MKTAIRITIFIWAALAVLAVVSAFAQTNGAPGLPATPFPQGKEAIWLAIVPPATFTVTWLIGKIPPLPKECLPWLTPLAGIALGAATKRATDSHWPWWSSAGAGAVSVAIYEAVKGLAKAGPDSKLTPTPKPDPSS